MNVSIPEALKGWAESRVAEGRYSSTSDYVRDLVRRDQEREEARRRLQAAIDEGRASGVSKRGIADVIAEGLESPEIDVAMDDVVADARERWAKGTSVSD